MPVVVAFSVPKPHLDVLISTPVAEVDEKVAVPDTSTDEFCMVKKTLQVKLPTILTSVLMKEAPDVVVSVIDPDSVTSPPLNVAPPAVVVMLIVDASRLVPVNAEVFCWLIVSVPPAANVPAVATTAAPVLAVMVTEPEARKLLADIDSPVLAEVIVAAVVVRLEILSRNIVTTPAPVVAAMTLVHDSLQDRRMSIALAVLELIVIEVPTSPCELSMTSPPIDPMPYVEPTTKILSSTS